MSNQNNDKRIDYVEFPSTDIPATKRFYESTFGWKFTDYGPDYVSFEDGRMTGGFRKAASVKQEGPLIVLYASKLEETETRVVKNGGVIAKPIFSFPGGRRFHFTDPGGNELAVWSDT